MCDNTIALNDEDYKEMNRFINNIKNDDNIRTNAIIEAYSNLVAYECYRWYMFDIMEEFDIEFIFKFVCNDNNYNIEKQLYKKQILDKAKEILEKKYNISLDSINN